MNRLRSRCLITRAAFRLGCAALLLAAASANASTIPVQARDLAVDGKRSEALSMLEQELRVNPENVDARLVYGIVLSWEGRWEEARRSLSAVLEAAPDYTDAREALIRVELWSEHPDRAEALAIEGQRRRPGHSFFLLNRVRAVHHQKREREAFDLVNNYLVLEPGNQEARQLRDQVEDAMRNWKVGFDRSHVWFSDGSSPWAESGVTLRGMAPWGRTGIRFSRASRFGMLGQLVEIDSYPRLADGTYLYLTGAFSRDRQLFPVYRAAAEVYRMLPHAFEASIGFRRFHFREPYTLYTGSLGRYFGNYYLIGRTFVGRDAGVWSPSFQVTARRYFGGHERFAAIRYGVGSSPFEVRSANEFDVLRSHSVTGEITGKLVSNWYYRAIFGISFQDRAGRPGIRQYILDGTLDYRF